MGKIITIGRQFGSGGHEIGEKLAKELNYAFYDRNLIVLAAEKCGISQGVLSEADEKAVNPWLYAAMSQTGQLNFDNTVSVNDTLFHLQSDIIRNIAKTEDAVIVGRCSDFILKNENADLLTVFIYAPMHERVKRIMKYNSISETQAAQLIKSTDKRRKSYYDFYTDSKWSSHSNYHITLNSEKFGIDGCAQIIVNSLNNTL